MLLFSHNSYSYFKSFTFSFTIIQEFQIIRNCFFKKKTKQTTKQTKQNKTCSRQSAGNAVTHT